MYTQGFFFFRLNQVYSLIEEILTMVTGVDRDLLSKGRPARIVTTSDKTSRSISSGPLRSIFKCHRKSTLLFVLSCLIN